jgi:DNA-directed RNA polymerase subunit RPC12/RpoP
MCVESTLLMCLDCNETFHDADTDAGQPVATDVSCPECGGSRIVFAAKSCWDGSIDQVLDTLWPAV